MIHETLSWNRTSERKPTSDRGPTVLVYIADRDETRVATVDLVNTHPEWFDWWAELPRPPRQ